MSTFAALRVSNVYRPGGVYTTIRTKQYNDGNGKVTLCNTGAEVISVA